MRALLLSLPLALTLACGEDDPKDDTQSTDSTPEDTQGDTELFDTGHYGELNGERPDEFLDLPEFTATAMTGDQRTQEHLVGHPSVLWFYPIADTAG